MFCNQCGTQVPDGTPVCPKCGAAMGNAAGVKVKKGNILDTFFATSDFLNWPALIAWLSTFLMTLIPWFKTSNYKGSKVIFRNMYVTGNAYVNHDFVTFVVLFLIGILVFLLMKKNWLSALLSGGFTLFVVIEAIVKAVRCSKYNGKMGPGLWLFLVFAMALCALCFLSSVFAKAMKNGAQRKAMMKQQQAAYNQQMMQQQMQYQQQPQMQQMQYQQAPQQMQYQQPQQPMQ